MQRPEPGAPGHRVGSHLRQGVCSICEAALKPVATGCMCGGEMLRREVTPEMDTRSQAGWRGSS